jgi:tetratricopeptide (TPR) repeat protein
VPVFAIACWALGMMAFAQLIAGLALGARLENSRQVRVVERTVTKLVAVQAPHQTDPVTEPVVIRPPAVAAAPIRAAAFSANLPPPTPLGLPRVADPLTEQLVTQARQARLAADTLNAIVKLQEAIDRSPHDPVVLFELGATHEEMGVFDTAADYYEKVARMEPAEAGILFTRANAKLRDGFQEDQPTGKVRLGRVQFFNNPGHPDGRQVVLTIPVECAPGEDLNAEDVEVKAEFFNRSKRDGIVMLEDESWVTQQNPTAPYDWADGEETMRVTYLIPHQDEATDHLFGELEYYGYVLTLVVRGEVVDLKAWPRDLAARSGQRGSGAYDPQAPEFFDPGNPQPGLDPYNPGVLPPLYPPNGP